MSFTFPKTVYGGAYAACAVLFLVSFIANVDDRFRYIGIALGAILFIIVTIVWWLDREKYYENLGWR
jgi:hypothetical protein